MEDVIFDWCVIVNFDPNIYYFSHEDSFRWDYIRSGPDVKATVASLFCFSINSSHPILVRSNGCLGHRVGHSRSGSNSISSSWLTTSSSRVAGGCPEGEVGVWAVAGSLENDCWTLGVLWATGHLYCQSLEFRQASGETSASFLIFPPSLASLGSSRVWPCGPRPLGIGSLAFGLHRYWGGDGWLASPCRGFGVGIGRSCPICTYHTFYRSGRLGGSCWLHERALMKSGVFVLFRQSYEIIILIIFISTCYIKIAAIMMTRRKTTYSKSQTDQPLKVAFKKDTSRLWKDISPYSQLFLNISWVVN